MLGVVFVGLEVLQLLGYRQEERILLLFVSIATALVTARTMGLCEATPWIPALPWGQGATRSKPPRRSRAPKPRRRSSGGGDVVAGPWASPGPGRSNPLPQPPSTAAAAGGLDDHAELDALLDKISAVGMDGLDADEKRRLNELSKRMRNRK